MKAAPVVHALRRRGGVRQSIVHTGQHYDCNTSGVFFHELRLEAPEINLEVGAGSHGQQTSQVILRFEEVVLKHKPDLVVVYGDVNSTVAAALVCAKLMVPVAHVEAGLRSFDRSMPEEINRVVTDQLAELLFTPSEDGNENLLSEGIRPDRIHFVGNVMIDTLVRMLPRAIRQLPKNLPQAYAFVTLDRPSNVDDLESMKSLLDALEEIGEMLPVLFPVHPRTRQRLATLGNLPKALQLLEPAPYLEFLGLQSRARVVITDSGGIQEETTFLGVPCLTVRENTERRITVTMGTNILVGRNMQKLYLELKRILSGNAKYGTIPPLWDGHAADRIAMLLVGGSTIRRSQVI